MYFDKLSYLAIHRPLGLPRSERVCFRKFHTRSTREKENKTEKMKVSEPWSCCKFRNNLAQGELTHTRLENDCTPGVIQVRGSLGGAWDEAG